MRFKVHQRQGETLVAGCDKELISKEIEGKANKFKVRPEFYGEENIKEEKAKKYLKKASIINVLGKKTVSCAIDAGVIDEKNVIEVAKGIPHAQMIKIS